MFYQVYGGEEFDDENFPENPHETKKERKERLGKEKREKDLADKKEKEREAKEKKERESNEKKEKGRLIKEKKEKEKEERLKLGDWLTHPHNVKNDPFLPLSLSLPLFFLPSPSL